MKKNNLKPINEPIFLSTTSAQSEPSQWGYSRVDNPTRLALEGKLAEIEKGKFALAFSSGSSAIACLFALFKGGDHILCHREIYEGTHRLLEKIFKRFKIKFDLVDFNDPGEVKKSIRTNTKLIFFENITNPNLEKINIKKIRRSVPKKIIVAIDSTVCTPVFENPLELGADIVVHSLTKFISGHHDVLAGAVMTNKIDLFNQLKFIQQTMGLVLDPFSCYLISRGLKTLDLRMEKHTANAKKVAEFLEKEREVEKVIFPGVSGVVSFQLDRKIDPIGFLKKLKFIKIAQSFGGAESTILHPVSMMKLAIPVNINLFRLSVGFENVEDIINDLTRALK
ncbi:aminotransferase class I/II-fold pyridoxal phosphate-dependent enzyme [Candidatus Roizmanbacteria bacterium]|nr:aminotransferase class I/II-fold pyridoxal phosphate-dependent enzyme [Candidatus Roizmanbacteria bacterium]